MSEKIRVAVQRKRTGPALQEGNPEWVPVAMVSEFKVHTLFPLSPDGLELAPCLMLNSFIDCLFWQVLTRETAEVVGPQDGKDTLPKILRDNSAIVLYQVGSEIYCSDANSTAFKFPLIDANIIESESFTVRLISKHAGPQSYHTTSAEFCFPMAHIPSRLLIF